MNSKIKCKERFSWLIYKVMLACSYVFFINKNAANIINFIYDFILKLNFNNYDKEILWAIIFSVITLTMLTWLIAEISFRFFKCLKNNILINFKAFKYIINIFNENNIIDSFVCVINKLVNMLYIGSLTMVMCFVMLSVNNMEVLENNKFANKIVSVICDSLDNSKIITTAKQRNTTYNGALLSNAVKSNADIENIAKSITSESDEDIIKARKIYNWIGRNIEYEYIENNGYLSENRGAIYAFSNLKGVCFDFASLFTAMARSLSLPVRLIIGDAYNGEITGRHAWNQVYIKEEERWINVDSTFWGDENAFDSKDFDQNHFEDYIAGEW